MSRKVPRLHTLLARSVRAISVLIDPPAYVPEFRIVVDQLPKRRSGRKAVEFISQPRLDLLIVFDQRGAPDAQRSWYSSATTNQSAYVSELGVCVRGDRAVGGTPPHAGKARLCDH